MVKKAVAKVVASPVRRSPALMESIADQIADGIPLREICRQPGMPTWRAVYQWMDEEPTFAAAIARTREIGGDAIAAHTLELSDTPPERGPDGRVDAGWVAWNKIRIEHRLKLLSKWNPKRYGDKVETVHTGPEGGPIALSLKVSFVSAS